MTELPASERTSAAWLARCDAYRDAVRDYQVDHGQDPESPAALSTLRTNTELVPGRADLLLGALEDFFDEQVEGKRVLELGCGFGVLASYLAWCGAPSEVVATDIREDLLATARQGCENLGLGGRLKFVRADMRNLSNLDGTFEIVIVANSFIYLPSRDAMGEAIAQIASVTEPGAAVLFYHANKWRPTEPFTKAPLVHLLPRRVGDLLQRAIGWRHNHGRVRLVSPPELRRLLGRAGFETVGVVGFAKSKHLTGWSRSFGGYYALGARRLSPPR